MAPRWHPDGTQMAPDGTQMAPLDIRRISELGGGGDVFFGVGTLILAYRKPSIVAQLPKLQGGQIFFRNFAFYK